MFMANKKVKSIKNPAARNAAAKSNNSAKTSKAKIALARININIPKSLHDKTKKLALKNKITLKEIFGAAIKEYLNKPAVLKTASDTKSTV